MSRPLLTVVCPTIGRPSLARTFASMREQAPASEVEIIVVGDTFGGDFRDALATVPAVCAEHQAKYVGHDGGLHCVGQPQRQRGMWHAQGEWLAFSQDDSMWLPEAWHAIRASLLAHPPCPRLFRVQTQWGFIVWATETVALGNCDADGIVVPNDVDRLGVWGLRYEGDFDFLQTTVELWDGAIRYEPALIAEAEPVAVRRRA